MDLHILWFILIGTLFVGFFVLEGFDFGVGMLVPFLLQYPQSGSKKTDSIPPSSETLQIEKVHTSQLNKSITSTPHKSNDEQRMLLNAIGPFWDANEVWLITAGGAMFAAFPDWYATFFSSFYPALLGVLLALIIRGAAFEFRNLVEHQRWRQTWDWLLCLGSLLPGFFWGVIVANVLMGIPIDAHMNFVGTPWQLFNPYALLCGLLFVAIFALHGATFLGLRLTGVLLSRARQVARWLWAPTLLLALGFALWSLLEVSIFRQMLLNPFIAPFDDIALVALLATGWLVATGRSGWAFGMTTAFIICAGITLCLGLFPQVLISSLNPAWSLTVYNTAASAYTLTILSWLALTALPLVLLYQAWNYWIFRKRLTQHAIEH